VAGAREMRSDAVKCAKNALIGVSVNTDAEAIVKLWMEKGDHDLINAKHTLTMRVNCPFDTVCFHAQQCVDKYLKALLMFCEVVEERC
jgi:hypothetical protein